MCNLKEISPFNRINLTSVEMGVVDRFKLLKTKHGGHLNSRISFQT